MGKSARARPVAYVKYAIPVAIVVIVLAVFFSLRSKREREPERAATEEAVTEQAVEHIETLKKQAKEPIDIEKADHFVGAETELSKKERRVVVTTPRQLLEEKSLTPESPIKILVEEEKTVITTPRELLRNRTIGPKTPITVLMEEEEVVLTTPRQLLEEESITFDTPIKVVMETGRIVVTTPRQLLEKESITLDTPIRVVMKRKKRFVVTTPEELLAKESVTLDTPIKVLLKEEKIVSTTPGQLLAEKSFTPETPIKIVLEEPGETVTVSKIFEGIEGTTLSGKTFYVHTVTPEDVQGIWGIIQHGLIDQFRKGIPVPKEDASGGEFVATLDLPRDADEPLQNGRSSFLGRILDRKTRESYVYNYQNGRMGKNPDYIQPGQELVVVQFTQDELVQIYKHFAQER